MFLTKTYTFSTSSTSSTSYIFDTSKVEIINNNLQLKLQETNSNFTESFNSTSGFVYDTTKAEFNAGQVQQKDMRPTNATFYTNYSSSINGNWGDGVLTGIPYGGASILGGKLDLSHNDIRYIKYPSSGNINNFTTGTIRFKITPNYSGTPSNYIPFFCFGDIDLFVENQISLWHYIGDGHLNFEVTNYLSSKVVSANFGVWNPIAGTEYEFEVSWDLVTGNNRMFINGIQKGTTNTQTGVITSLQYIKIGNGYDNSYSSNFSINDILIFSTIQHTSNYTPDWSNIYETIYAETSVTLPEMEHTGDGSILAFNFFATTELNTPKYTLQIGRSGYYLYWNGLSWVVSDGTYNQATDSITFNTNCIYFDVEGEKFGQFKIIFQNSNTISYISELTANMRVNNGYSTENPLVIFNDSFRSDTLYNFSESVTNSSMIMTKYNLFKNSTYYYYSTVSTGWAISNSSYSQSNFSSEINSNCTSFINSGTDISLTCFLHSEDGINTPKLSLIAFTYDFTGDSSPTMNTHVYYGYLKNIDNTNLENKVISVRTNYLLGKYTLLNDKVITTNSESNGYWEMNIYFEDIKPDRLYWNIDGKNYISEFSTETYLFSELRKFRG